MSDCCTLPAGNADHPRKQRCPVNGHEYAEVSARTIVHHVKDAWHWQPTAGRYFFCDDPACDVVYFGDDGSTIRKSQLRTPVGAKTHADDDLLCYCFGVSRSDYRRDPATREFVIAQTRAGLCTCDTRNPSGRCCLGDFPKPGD